MAYIKYSDEYYMNLALKQAKFAYDNGDVPIGVVLVYNEYKKNKKMTKVMDKLKIKDKTILARAYNRRNKDTNAVSHAEILAITKACKKIKDFRLENVTMYVTLEPCPMCAGAILQSRIKRLVIASKSKKSGAVGSIINSILAYCVSVNYCKFFTVFSVCLYSAKTSSYSGTSVKIIDISFV